MKRLLCLALVLLLALPLTAAAEPAAPCNNWYEVFVRSYQDSDGDGIGDLQGLISRLDYIREMGYNGLWLMPVMPSPSYHKYDVTNYLEIDHEYGSLADMRRLIDAAHDRGMKLIIDLPINHTSTQHPWFQYACDALRQGMDCEYIDYYRFQREPYSGFVPLADTGWYYEEQFAGGNMPDLNLDSEDVWAQIAVIADFWLRVMDVDGFRLDAVTSYYTKDTDKNVDFLRRFKALCDELKPDNYLVGECWAGLSTIAQYYESGVDSFFLFPASQAEGFIAASMRGRSGHAEKFVRSYQSVLDAIPQGVLAPFLANHDTGRALGSVQGRENLPIAKFAEGVLNMMQGNVFTYYGEEIGMVGAGEDPNKRLAMYWNDGDMTAQPPGVTRLEYAFPSVDAQKNDPDSLLNYCKAVNAVRLAYPMIANGENEFVHVSGDVCLMRRTWQGESCLIAMNFSAKETLSCPVPEGCALADQLLTGSEACVLNGAEIVLPPYAIAILYKN